ncbi:MAG: hypothetical protein Q4C80_01490 [Bacillota bacterium]|nr:hypothetical protein [Bacillota bacterium]
MKKKLLMIIMAIVLCFTMAACGGGGGDANSDIDPNATVTKEQYEKLSADKWHELTPEEMERYLEVRYVEDEESTKSWGKGYLVVDFPGPDEDSYIHVLFKEGDDGKMTPSSMSATGKFLD